jgi:hypothetical protein
LNVPDTVGVLIVMVFEANAAVTPAGNPVAVPIPVAPVVAWVISVNTVLIHNVGVDDALVVGVVTVLVAVALAQPQFQLRYMLW